MSTAQAAIAGSRGLTMPAAVIVAPGRSAVRQVAVPEPGPEEIRVRLEGCGVCGSNLPVWEGRDWFEYPQSAGAPGHEGWGIVDAVGSAVRDVAIGQRVAILGSHAFAAFDLAPADAVVRIPDALAGSPVPAEPLGCAINVFRRCGIRPGHTVAIVGIGFLGALLTQLAARAGARVIAISRRPFALDIARTHGAAHTIVMDDHHRILGEVTDHTGGTGCDVVIEAVGTQWPLDLAGELVRERGRLVIAGFHQDGPRQVNMFLWNWRGIDVVNAHERETARYIDGMRAAMDALAAGTLHIDSLLTHRLPLDGLDAAFALMRDRPDGFMKALVLM